MGYFGQVLNMGAAVLTGPNATPGQNNIAGATPIPTAFGPSGSTGSNLPVSSGMPTVGGGAIMGVSPAVDKDSILVYKTKSHYTEWEFVYDPMSDRGVGMPFPMEPTGPPTNTGAPGFGPPGSPTTPPPATTPK